MSDKKALEPDDWGRTVKQPLPGEMQEAVARFNARVDPEDKLFSPYTPCDPPAPPREKLKIPDPTEKEPATWGFPSWGLLDVDPPDKVTKLQNEVIMLRRELADAQARIRRLETSVDPTPTYNWPIVSVVEIEEGVYEGGGYRIKTPRAAPDHFTTMRTPWGVWRLIKMPNPPIRKIKLTTSKT